MSARRSISLASVWLCVAAGALLWCGAPASAQLMHEFSFSFGSEGSGEGQLKHPGLLAVNEETGNVYAIDRENGRVEIFSSLGGVRRPVQWQRGARRSVLVAVHGRRDRVQRRTYWSGRRDRD